MKRAILYTLASIVLVSFAFPLSAGACYRMETLQQVLDNYAGSCELEYTYESYNGGDLVYAKVWEICNNNRESWVSYAENDGMFDQSFCGNVLRCNGTGGYDYKCGQYYNVKDWAALINTYCDGSTTNAYFGPPAGMASQGECLIGSGTIPNACDDYSKTLYASIMIKDCKDLDGDGQYREGDYYCPCGDDCDDSDGDIYPGNTESCDNQDNDCNGIADDNIPGAGDSCNIPGELGLCAIGAEACVDNDGTFEMQCVQTYSSRPEVCDGKDNDCDGVTDEDNPGEGDYCHTGLDGICGPGTTVCDGANGVVCQQNEYAGPEICDGLDNDCNSATADGSGEAGYGTSCTNGTGPCANDTGTKICNGTELVCNAIPYAPGERNCKSSADNNCNGIDDNKEKDCNDDDGKTCIGSTADVRTGKYKHSQGLFGGAVLYYDSFGAYSSTVAPQWRLGYNMTLEAKSGGTVIITEGDGQQRAYVPTIDGYISGEGDTSTLNDNGDGTWDMTSVSGTVSHFDVDGKPASITAKTGETVLMTYSSGLLVSITDSTEPAPVTIDYVDGIIDTLTDSYGNVYDLNYYPDGTLQEVVYPLPLSYTLDVPQPDGTTQSVTYPGAGATNPKWTYTYENGLLKTKTDTNGKVTTYNFVNGKIESSTVSSDYGDRTQDLNFGNYTGDQRETIKTGMDGGDWKYRYSASSGKITEKEDPEGGITRYEYEGDLVKHIFSPDNQRESIYRYDGNDNLLVSVEKELVGAMRAYSTTYSYNAFGLLSTTSTPLEGAFDDAGLPVSSITNTYRYDDKGQTTYIGDSLGRETFIHYSTIGAEKHVTTTDPLGRVSIVVYDDKDRLISSTAPSSVTGVDASTSYTYGVLGNMSTVTDTAGRVTRYKYDSLGRMVQIIGSNDTRITNVYNTDGSIESVIDAEGNKTSYSYTNLGQQKVIIDALNNATFMSYSAAGCGSCGGGVDKLAQVTDANGKATTYTYDKLGRLLSESDATGLQKSLSYNTNRYEYTKTDARGIAVTYVNDYMGRLIVKKVDGVTKETYSYYLNGGLHTAQKDGLTYSYTYYAGGQVRDVSDSNGKTLSYKYNAAGSRTEVKISDGVNPDRTLTYNYTDANQLDTITAEPGVFDFDYRVDGSRETLSYPNGVTTSYSYDASGRLKGINSVNSSAATIIFSTYSTFDKVGNRTMIISGDGTETSTSSYSYDDLYRLTDAGHSRVGGTEEGSQFENYTYDAIGNRQAMGNDMLNNFYPGYEIPEGSDPDYDYHKDANDNFWTPITVKWGQTSFDYDYENRLTRVKRTFNNSSTVVDYAYDVFGRRIERKVTTDGTLLLTTNYLYDNEDIVAIYENGTLTKEFIHGPGIDEPLAIKTGGSWNYYHADGLGSVMALTDGSGAKVGSTYGYDSFGNLVKGSLDKVYTYTGREWDVEAGLYYYRARFYDPEVGRFISKDPIGFAAGDVNLYSYVGQNPVNYNDPMGLEKLPECVTKLLSPYFDGLDLKQIEIHEGTFPWHVRWFSAVEPDAYTADANNIYFKSGQYDPESAKGISLIAHELVHCEQYKKEGKYEFRNKYLEEYLINRMKGMSKYDAYRNISFEQVAYIKQEKIYKKLKLLEIIIGKKLCDGCR
ncbi:MAG: MopE-related protein [Deltaproteobacteria bacterium]|nr:MopE-related protein [Deltaproteobacteria bacterium]